MRSKLLSLLPSLLVSLLFFAQGTIAQENTGSKEALLSNMFPTSCSFSGQFSQQKNIEGLPVPLISNGDFFFSCDLGLIWSTDTPFIEAILYANAANSYRINDKGDVTPLTGIARYSMSKIVMKLLNGDTQYFAEEFSIVPSNNADEIKLQPKGSYMKKGIEHILLTVDKRDEQNKSIDFIILDTTGQTTQVAINGIVEHDIEGRRASFEQCEEHYPDTTFWCKILRSPSYLERY